MMKSYNVNKIFIVKLSFVIILSGRSGIYSGRSGI